MINIKFDERTNEFKGNCPRCGEGGFFSVRSGFTYGTTEVKIVLCHMEHMFSIEHFTGRPTSILGAWPIEFIEKIPQWLPGEYHGPFSEMYEDYSCNRYRSCIAMCSMILDAFLSSQLPNEGDRKKTLYPKIEAARNLGKLDHDQFSEATVMRLTRNEVLHPEEILSEVTKEEASEAMEAVMAVLERSFKFRSSRALPPGTEPPEVGIKVS